jgi:hypothetical protein
MKLILDTLEAARLTASPSEADALRVALIDLQALADVLDARGAALDDVPAALGAHQALREHIQAQPFDACESLDGSPAVDDVTPGAFIGWLDTLERLAR